jgi:hypothetical protein
MSKKSKLSLEERIQLARDIVKKFPLVEIDIPPCPRCGRCIGSGVSKLCSDKSCPNKH